MRLDQLIACNVSGTAHSFREKPAGPLSHAELGLAQLRHRSVVVGGEKKEVQGGRHKMRQKPGDGEPE